ncbi:hypothetical protein VaNZ11_016914, partial [Volvox africanus]
MDTERNETWPDTLLPSPLQPGATAQPSINGWTFASHQSPLSDFSKAVDLSAEFPFSALKHLPDESAVWASSTPCSGPPQPPHQFSHFHNHHHQAAASATIGSRCINMVVHTTATCEESPGPQSPEHCHNPLLYEAAAFHDEAEAVLSLFRQNLSRSMTLHDSRSVSRTAGSADRLFPPGSRSRADSGDGAEDGVDSKDATLFPPPPFLLPPGPSFSQISNQPVSTRTVHSPSTNTTPPLPLPVPIPELSILGHGDQSESPDPSFEGQQKGTEQTFWFTGATAPAETPSVASLVKPELKVKESAFKSMSGPMSASTSLADPRSVTSGPQRRLNWEEEASSSSAGTWRSRYGSETKAAAELSGRPSSLRRRPQSQTNHWRGYARPAGGSRHPHNQRDYQPHREGSSGSSTTTTTTTTKRTTPLLVPKRLTLMTPMALTAAASTPASSNSPNCLQLHQGADGTDTPVGQRGRSEPCSGSEVPLGRSGKLYSNVAPAAEQPPQPQPQQFLGETTPLCQSYQHHSEYPEADPSSAGFNFAALLASPPLTLTTPYSVQLPTECEGVALGFLTLTPTAVDDGGGGGSGHGNCTSETLLPGHENLHWAGFVRSGESSFTTIGSEEQQEQQQQQHQEQKQERGLHSLTCENICGWSDKQQQQQGHEQGREQGQEQHVLGATAPAPSPSPSQLDAGWWRAVEPGSNELPPPPPGIVNSSSSGLRHAEQCSPLLPLPAAEWTAVDTQVGYTPDPWLPAGAAGAAYRISSMPPSSSTTTTTAMMPTMPCMALQQTPEATATTTTATFNPHGIFDLDYGNPAFDNTAQEAPVNAESDGGGLSGGDAAYGVPGANGGACWPVFVEEGEKEGEKNVGREREWMVMSPGMNVLGMPKREQPELAHAEHIDEDGIGSSSGCFEAESPVPPDYPWLSGSPVGAFGSPGGSPSAASGSTSTIRNRNRSELSAPQHTDLSNLLDTSSSYSVAGARDSDRPDRDTLQMLSSRSLCESSGQMGGPGIMMHDANGPGGTPAAVTRAQLLQPSSMSRQHIREDEEEGEEDELAHAEHIREDQQEGRGEQEEEGGFSNPPDIFFQGLESPSFYLVGGGLEQRAIAVHGRTPGVVLHQPGMWLGGPAWASEGGSFPTSLGAHTDDEEDNGEEAATLGLGHPHEDAGTQFIVGTAPGHRAGITTLPGSADGGRGGPNTGNLGSDFAEEEEEALEEEEEEEDHERSSVGSVVDDHPILAAQEMVDGQMAANVMPHGATELSERAMCLFADNKSRPLSKLSLPSEREDASDARQHVWQHARLQPGSWQHLQYNHDGEHDICTFSMQPGLAPPRAHNGHNWMSGDGVHHGICNNRGGADGASHGLLSSGVSLPTAYSTSSGAAIAVAAIAVAETAAIAAVAAGAPSGIVAPLISSASEVVQLRELPSYEMSWASETDIVADPSRAWGSTASRRETRDTDQGSVSFSVKGAEAAGTGAGAGARGGGGRGGRGEGGGGGVAADVRWTGEAAAQGRGEVFALHPTATAVNGDTDADGYGEDADLSLVQGELVPARGEAAVFLQHPVATDMTPPDDTFPDAVLLTESGAAAMLTRLTSPGKGGAGSSFSFGCHGAVSSTGKTRYVSTFQTCPHRSPRRSPRTRVTGAATSGGGSAWLVVAEGKARRYDPSGYRSSDSGTEYGGTDPDIGSARQMDATPRVDSDTKTFRSWQIQENPAFEEDIETTSGSAHLAPYRASSQLNQLSPLTCPSSFSVGTFAGGNGGDDINSARDGSNADANEMPAPVDMTNHAGGRIGAAPAASKWTATLTAAARAPTAPPPALTAWNTASRIATAHTDGAIAHPTIAMERGRGNDGAGVSETLGGGGSNSSSESDSPRTSAFNRVLASGGLGATASRSRVRHLAARRGAARGGGGGLMTMTMMMMNDQADQAAAGAAAAATGAAAPSEDVDVDVDDRRDTLTSRTLGSHSTSGGGGGAAPASANVSRRGGISLSAVKSSEDRSLILELEHAHTLLLQALAAAGEPPLLTPPPPSPVPASGPYTDHRSLSAGTPLADGVGGMATAAGAAGAAGAGAGAATRTTTAAAAATEGAGAAAAAATGTPGFSSGSGGSSRGDSDGLHISSCSSLTHGIGNPLVAQVAMTAMGKALARVAKLSRENQGLQHVNEQLRSELSHSSSKHMELQIRSKLLHAMLTESGREAEKRAQAQQRQFLRMDAQHSGSLHRIRELERINTQLTLESKQVQRQLQQAQAQLSETNHATASLRGQVALLEQQLTAAHAAREAELQLTDALSEATKNSAALLHQVAVLEQRLEAAQVSGEAQRRSAEVRQGQVEALEEAQKAMSDGAAAGTGSVHGASNMELRQSLEVTEAEAMMEGLRRQVEVLEDQLREMRSGAANVEMERCQTEREMQMQVEQLRCACAEAESRTQDLQAKLLAAQAHAGQQVSQLEAELHAAREELRNLQSVEDAAAKKEQQLQAELQAARVAMAELRAERAAARAEALRREDDAQKASLAAQDARSEAEIAAADYARASAEAREADQRHAVALAEVEAVVSDLRQQLDEATWESQRLASQATLAEQRVEDVEAREREMMEQLRRAVAEAERARADLDEARQALADKASAANEAIAESSAMVSELEMALATEVARVIEETQRREEAELAHRKEVQELHSQLQATLESQQRADAERRDLQGQHIAACDQMEQLAAQLSAARDELEDLQQERDQLRSEHTQLMDEANQKATHLANALAEASALRNYMAVLDNEKQKLWTDLSAAEGRACEVMGRLAEAQVAHSSLVSELEGLRRELVEAREAAAETRSRLAEAEAVKEGMEAQIHKLWKEMEEESVMAQKAEERFADAEVALKELRDKVDSLVEDLESAQAVLAEREAQLEKASGELQAAAEAHSHALAEAEARGREAQARAEAAAEAQARMLAETQARAEAAEAACAEAQTALDVERIKAADLEAEMQVATRKMVELQKMVEAQAQAAASGGEEQSQRRLLGSVADVVASCMTPAGGETSTITTLTTTTNTTTTASAFAPTTTTTTAAMSSPPRLLKPETPSEEMPSTHHLAKDASSSLLVCESFSEQRQHQQQHILPPLQAHPSDLKAASETSPGSGRLKLAGQVVAAQAELADLQSRHADAEEMIGRLRLDLSDQRRRCMELEAQLQDREDDLAAVRRQREDALLQVREAQRQREAAAAAAAAAAVSVSMAPTGLSHQAVGGGDFLGSGNANANANGHGHCSGMGGGGARDQQHHLAPHLLPPPPSTSVAFSSAAWSPSSSLHVGRCSTIMMPLSPTTRSSSLLLRDSATTLFDEGRLLPHRHAGNGFLDSRSFDAARDGVVYSS